MFEWYEAEVRALERKRETEPVIEAPIVFYGSSSIRLWTTLKQDFPGMPAVNVGFGGSTLRACSYFFDRLVVPYRPKAIIVYAGDNDLGDGQTAEDVFVSYQMLWGKSRQFFGPISFSYISIKPSIARWAIDNRIRRANAMIHQEMEGRDSTYWIDIYEAMLGADGKPRRELYEADGLHLSPAGYRLWTERVLAHPESLSQGASKK